VDRWCVQLCLANTKLRDGSVEAVAAALAANAARGEDRVAVLRLQRNFLSDSGAGALGSYLATPGCATEVLHLSTNDIGDEGVALLAHGVERASAGGGGRLRELHLANNKFEEEGAAALARALRGHSSLELLVLSYNPVGAEGAKALAASVRGGPSAGAGSVLRDLRLTRCGLGDGGATALGAALTSPDCPLVHLDLGLNGIGDGGASALARGLAVNGRLESLLLTGHPVSLRGVDEDHEGDPVGDQGAVAIAEALMNNPKSRLKLLDLSRGKVGDAGAAALGKMLREDKHLVKPMNAKGEKGVFVFAASSRGQMMRRPILQPHV